ncbi:MAG: hypothetical protein ACRDKW_08700, partial [Actinomycetota bacterium]
MNLVRRHPWILGATGLYVAGFTLAGALLRNPRAPLYGAVMVAGFPVVAAADCRVHFGPGVLAGLSVWGLLHMAGGLLPGLAPGDGILYDSWIVRPVVRVDQAVHAVGYAVTTTACLAVLRARDPQGPAPVLTAVLMGAGLGAVNEVVEFLATRAFAGLRIGGFENMGWDLVFNLLGAGAAALWLWVPAERMERAGAA